MSEHLTTLSYAVRPKVIAKYLGQLMIMLAGLTTVPLVVSMLYSDLHLGARFFAVILLLLVFGIPCSKLPSPTHIQTNEALSIAALTFLSASILMAFPLAAEIPFDDALFESVSAITTTGLSTLPTVEDKSETFLFARAWAQWYAGLGIVVLSVALLMGHHIAARQLTEQTSGENLVTTTQLYARRVLTAYIVLTLLGIAVTWVLSGDISTSVNYILSGISTAGFAPADGSLAAFAQWHIRLAIMLFALLGALPLLIYYYLYQRDWSKILGNSEIKIFLSAVILTVSLLALFMLYNSHDPALDTLGHAVIIGISAQTTTGFTSADIADFDAGTKTVLILSMLAGGCIGSTAGGVKIMRIMVFFRLLQLTIRRTALPSHAVITPRLSGKPLEDSDIIRGLSLILLFILIIFVSWLIFLAFGHDPLNALFDITSATATTGLSAGVVHQGLHPVLKFILCIDMLLGRLEMIAILVVLYPHTWFGKRRESP